MSQNKKFWNSLNILFLCEKNKISLMQVCVSDLTIFREWAKSISIPTFQIQILNRCYCRKKSYRFCSHFQNRIRTPYRIRILMFSESQSYRQYVISIFEFLHKISLVACVVWNSSFSFPINAYRRNALALLFSLSSFSFILDE